MRRLCWIALLSASGTIGCSNPLGEPDPCVPDRPYIETVTETDFCAVSITWRVNEAYSWHVSVDSYTLQRKGGVQQLEFETIATFGYSSRAHTDENLEPATSYTYRLRSANNCGSSAWSVARTCKTSPAAPLPGRIWHVPGEATTIQAAIDVAEAGDTIVVASGTYAAPEIQIWGKSGICLRGESGEASGVILDLSGTSDPIYSMDVDWFTLEGFTITGGRGGGLHLRGKAWSHIAIRDCDFVGNSTTFGGGGVKADDCSPVFENCTFRYNSTNGFGGGLRYLGEGVVTLVDCEFAGNEATAGGGGLYLQGSGVIEACHFSDNGVDRESNHGGGAMMLTGQGKEVSLMDCVMTGNYSTPTGGGIFLTPGSQTRLTARESEILENSALRGADGYVGASCLARLICCDIDSAGWETIGTLLVEGDACDGR